MRNQGTNNRSASGASLILSESQKDAIPLLFSHFNYGRPERAAVARSDYPDKRVWEMPLPSNDRPPFPLTLRMQSTLMAAVNGMD